jgi:electron transport complex protein RnfD
MLTVILSLLPTTVFGVITFGIPALITIVLSVASCVCFEALFRKITKQDNRVKDFSAVVTGLLMALVMPPSVPAWMVILGGLFAVVVAKEFFGGLGANVFNPALAARAMLFISFPASMATWTAPKGADAVSGATMLAQLGEGGGFVADSSTYLQYFIGTRAGCIGETSILCSLVGAIILLVTRTIDFRAPLAMIATVALGTLVAGGDVLLALLSGGLLFGAVFMTTDYTTAPVTRGGRVVFGIGCGLITFLIRQFGGYPEGVMFSILIMNILTPFLNNIIPRKYGFVPVKKGDAK